MPSSFSAVSPKSGVLSANSSVASAKALKILQAQSITCDQRTLKAHYYAHGVTQCHSHAPIM